MKPKHRYFVTGKLQYEPQVRTLEILPDFSIACNIEEQTTCFIAETTKKKSWQLTKI